MRVRPVTSQPIRVAGTQAGCQAQPHCIAGSGSGLSLCSSHGETNRATTSELTANQQHSPSQTSILNTHYVSDNWPSFIDNFNSQD